MRRKLCYIIKAFLPYIFTSFLLYATQSWINEVIFLLAVTPRGDLCQLENAFNYGFFSTLRIVFFGENVFCLARENMKLSLLEAQCKELSVFINTCIESFQTSKQNIVTSSTNASNKPHMSWHISIDSVMSVAPFAKFFSLFRRIFHITCHIKCFVNNVACVFSHA